MLIFIMFCVNFDNYILSLQYETTILKTKLEKIFNYGKRSDKNHTSKAPR